MNPPKNPPKKPEGITTEFTDIFGALTPRQAGIITIGSAIGTGLMVGSGRALAMSGPAAIMISYTLVGFAVFLVLCALGEVAAWLPKPCTVADQAFRFCDPALGFSLGWIYWLKYAIVTPNQLTAAALVITLWLDAETVNPGVWITVFLLIIVALNYIHHNLPSHVEFFVSSFKLIVMSALMVLSLVLALGGGPDHRVRGFRYWKHPGAFVHWTHNTLENFFHTCAAFSSATFAYIGSERSGFLARSPNVPKAMNRAIKHTFYRILVFHILGITLIGMMVPHNSSKLAFYQGSGKHPAASPFVAALVSAGLTVVPDMLNAYILVFIVSIANYDLYLATKALSDLSIKRRAPAFLSRVNSKGVPLYALAISACVSSLAYLNVSQDSGMVFGYLLDIVTMLGLLTWISILITHICFVRARNAQGISDDMLVFKARFGLPGTWLGLALCLFISSTMIFNSLPINNNQLMGFDFKKFAASYVGVPIYIILYVGYKIILKSKRIRPEDADFWSDQQGGRRPAVEL
ncbi:Amino acid/polyamine transporter I [Penicillium canariense]|uniref:Amino acid/polyamine transporter I n=1 Tax=Penicillium canariense TaxID=189055 RepID=A0A9W9IMU3_9EURO|nr:Amino acid/polyamine transporter I [Penicillium canariense]KAJ5177176.1 Amino acid/polyamine transporter I [Penicillium canariense]